MGLSGSMKNCLSNETGPQKTELDVAGGVVIWLYHIHTSRKQAHIKDGFLRPHVQCLSLRAYELQ